MQFNDSAPQMGDDNSSSSTPPASLTSIPHDLFDRVYAQLRALAQKQMNVERQGHTLSATALVHEAYLAERMPIMVLNDEGHHCWRPARDDEAEGGSENGQVMESGEGEEEEARVWLSGLDRLNNSQPGRARGVSFCVDLSATPFYIKGSGHPEGWPFPWIVSDFGLVDAIESGIVKIPRLPVQDTTGRPEPKYFRLWEWVKESMQPGDYLPGRARSPKPEAVWRESEAALHQLGGQWMERFQQMQAAKPGQECIPPVLIIVCDNTDIAAFFFQKISGEREELITTQEEVDEVLGEQSEVDQDEDSGQKRKKKSKPKSKTVYERGALYPEYFSNEPGVRRTLRIDSKLLAEAESDDPNKKKSDAAEELRRIVATVGKPGLPGEHIRCVVSVSMLTEGWDANDVTHILGIRAFGSQLLCEQVVGRGLRRIDYTPDPETGRLTEEYVDVYGIPFSVIPYKGRSSKSKAPEDKPKNHVKALEERARMEIRFPVVEGYSFALQRNLIRCDVDSMESMELEPNREPTATYLAPTLGYKEGHPSSGGASREFVEQNREDFYALTHLQEIQFRIARLVVHRLLGGGANGADAKARVLGLQSRHQLFPQVYRFVADYVSRKVDFADANPCELGLERYVHRLVDRFADAIMPDESQGEPPLMPVLNRYKPIGTTADVNFKTTKPCWDTRHSHIDQVVADTHVWEQAAAFRLEQQVGRTVQFYVKNDHLGFVIPYEFNGIERSYEPDFLVRMADGKTLVLEIKGQMGGEERAKHQAARRWVEAVNNWSGLGRWEFHVCLDPQRLGGELVALIKARSAA